MSSPYHSEFPERQEGQTVPRPVLRTKAPQIGMGGGGMRWPSAPGSPRKVFKPHGRKVRIRAQGNV